MTTTRPGSRPGNRSHTPHPQPQPPRHFNAAKFMTDIWAKAQDAGHTSWRRIATYTGVSLPTLSRVNNLTRNPDANNLIRLAAAYHLTDLTPYITTTPPTTTPERRSPDNGAHHLHDNQQNHLATRPLG